MHFNTLHKHMYLTGQLTQAQILGFYSEKTAADFVTSINSYKVLHG